MYEYKKINIVWLCIIGAFILYGIVLVFFGLPLINGNITKNTIYADIVEANVSTAIFFRIYNYAWVAVISAVIIGAILICLQGWFQRAIISKKKAVILAVILHSEFWISALVLILSATITFSNFAIYQIGESEELKEFARAYSVKYTGVTLLFIIFSFFLAKEAWRYRLKDASRVCSDYYIQEHLKAINNENINAAKQAIEKACEICPRNVSAWSIRSHFSNIDLSNKKDAFLFLNKAREILYKDKSVRKEDRCDYEYFLGAYLLSQEKYSEAVEHIDNSINLIYKKERADFLEKIRREINKYRISDYGN